MNQSKRLSKEIKDMAHSPPGGCSAAPIKSSDITKWNATITGPPDTPYEGGVFQLELQFPSDYPFHAPRVTFKTRVYHPNINTDGEICLDILKDQWTPALRVGDLLISIASLLETPNPDDPLHTESANLYKANREAYDKKVREYVQKYAS